MGGANARNDFDSRRKGNLGIGRMYIISESLRPYGEGVQLGKSFIRCLTLIFERLVTLFAASARALVAPHISSVSVFAFLSFSLPTSIINCTMPQFLQTHSPAIQSGKEHRTRCIDVAENAPEILRAGAVSPCSHGRITGADRALHLPNPADPSLVFIEEP